MATTTIKKCAIVNMQGRLGLERRGSIIKGKTV